MEQETEQTQQEETTEQKQEESTSTTQTETKKEESIGLTDLYLRRIQEQQEEIARLRAVQVTTQQTKETNDPSQLFKNPHEMFSKIVQDAVAPLQKDFNAFKRQKNANELKDVFRKNQNYKPFFDRIEPVLDATLANLIADDSVEINSSIMERTLDMIVGGYVTNKIPNLPYEPPTQEKKQATQLESDKAMPAHLRPTASRTIEEVKPKFQLDEQQKRVAREQGLTEEQYWDLLNKSAREVAIKPKEEKK